MSAPAYLVLAHADPVHLGRLVRALGDSSDVFVHVDAKVDQGPFVAAAGRAAFIEERVRVFWAGYSMVEAIMRLIRRALDSGREYTHFVLLSGADYPIKPQSEICAHLVENRGRQFIKYIDMRESKDHYLRQVTRKHFQDPVFGESLVDRAIRKVLRSINLPNKWDPSIVPYFGSNWWALTPDCCRYIVEFVEANNGFEAMNRRTFSPDEHFFHTIVGNSPFAAQSSGVQEYLGVGTVNLANLHLIDPSLAKWFTLEDYDLIAKSDRYFVRKVSTELSTTLLDALDQRILGVDRP